MVDILSKPRVSAREPAEAIEPDVAEHDAGVEGEECDRHPDDAVSHEDADDDRRRVFEDEGAEDDGERQEHGATSRAADEVGNEGRHVNRFSLPDF